MADNNGKINLTKEYEARIREENELRKQKYIHVSQTPPVTPPYNQNANVSGRPGPLYTQPKKEKKLGLVPIIIIGAILFSMLSEAGLLPLVPVGIIGFVAFKVGKKILKDNKEYVNTVVKEEPPVVKENKEKPKTVKKEQVVQEEKFTTGDPEIDRMIDDKENAVKEMKRLNAAIEDPTISAQIDHLEEVTTKILNHIIQHPNKKAQVSRFFNYYLPTTLKLLNAYDRMDEAGISGTNIDGTKGKVEEMMTTAMAAFDRQLDALFADDALDVATDITVMESLLKSEGLTDDNITLKLN